MKTLVKPAEGAATTRTDQPILGCAAIAGYINAVADSLALIDDVQTGRVTGAVIPFGPAFIICGKQKGAPAFWRLDVHTEPRPITELRLVFKETGPELHLQLGPAA